MSKELMEFTPEYRTKVLELKTLRRHNRLSNSQLAAMFDLEHAQMADTELFGKKAIPYEKLKEIVQYLKDGPKLETEKDPTTSGYYVDIIKLSTDIRNKYDKHEGTLASFAGQIGVASGTISLIMKMRYKSNPTKQLVEKICNGLGLNSKDYIKPPKITFEKELDLSCFDTFGKKLKALREHRHLTQDDLATKMGVSGQSISSLELGKTSINNVVAEKVQKMSDILHYDIKQLISENELIVEDKVTIEEIVDNVTDSCDDITTEQNSIKPNDYILLSDLSKKIDRTISINSNQFTDNNYKKLISLLHTINIMIGSEIDFDFKYSIDVK